MTVKTTLSFTERHHSFLAEKVEQGVYATASSAVAAAVERMMEDEAEREVALTALAEHVRTRMATPREDYVGGEDVFRPARAVVDDAARQKV